jgi:hypothetical protein
VPECVPADGSELAEFSNPTFAPAMTSPDGGEQVSAESAYILSATIACVKYQHIVA